MADLFDRDKWCRLSEAHQHLNGAIPEKTIRQWAAMRRIASMRIGGTVFVSIDGLKAMVKVTPAEVANG